MMTQLIYVTAKGYLCFDCVKLINNLLIFEVEILIDDFLNGVMGRK